MSCSVSWSWGKKAVTVAGAALLTELTPRADRPRWQGRSDTFMSASGARHYEQFDELLAALDQQLGGNTKATVLVKGSRFMKMERVVQHLTGSTTTSNKDAH